MPRTRDGRRPGRAAAVTALSVLLAAACGGAVDGAAGGDPSSTATAPVSPPAAATTEPTDTPSAVPVAAQLADPVAVAVPAAGIDANVVPIAVDTGNVLVPPPYGDAGWWRAGPEPGENGAAVIAGHLDSRDGPDVFHRLGDVAPGDEIVVTRADGGASTFRVVEVGQYPQDAFPTDAVYAAPDDRPLLRLITCGGEYDRELGRYRDNLVVFAELRH